MIERKNPRPHNSNYAKGLSSKPFRIRAAQTSSASSSTGHDELETDTTPELDHTVIVTHKLRLPQNRFVGVAPIAKSFGR